MKHILKKSVSNWPRTSCKSCFYISQRWNDLEQKKHLNPFWNLRANDGTTSSVTAPDSSEMSQDELKKTLFFGSAEDPVIEQEQENENANGNQTQTWDVIDSIVGNSDSEGSSESSSERSTADFFRPSKDSSPTKYTQSQSPFALFGSETAEKLQRDTQTQQFEKNKISLFSESTQEAIDNNIQRIHGAYYRVTPKEIKQFEQNGYIVLPQIVSPTMREEFPLIEKTLMQIMSDLILFDKNEYYDVEYNLTLNNENANTNTFASNQNYKQTITNIYNLTKLLIENDSVNDSNENEMDFRSNYFELRSLSIARQLLLNEIIHNKTKRTTNNETSNNEESGESGESEDSSSTSKYSDFALKLITDTCVMIDRNNFVKTMDSEFSNDNFVQRQFNPAQLAEIFNDKHSLYRRETDNNTILLASVLGLENAIMTLNLKDWDSNQNSPNVPLPMGSVLLFDVRKVSQVFWWRINNIPSAFMCNFYGFKHK